MNFTHEHFYLALSSIERRWGDKKSYFEQFFTFSTDVNKNRQKHKNLTNSACQPIHTEYRECFMEFGKSDDSTAINDLFIATQWFKVSILLWIQFRVLEIGFCSYSPSVEPFLFPKIKAE
jgi:hypothetical protein